MAEDIEKTNKPEVILNKKNKTAPEQKTEFKKKVLIKKQKPAAEKTGKIEQNSEKKPSGSISKDTPKKVVSVKKADLQPIRQKKNR